jgi:hypothetical protein
MKSGVQQTDQYSFENEDPLFRSLENTSTLLENRFDAVAAYYIDFLGKEEYALRAQASISLRTKRQPE